MILAGLAGAVAGLIIAAVTFPQGRLMIDLSALSIGALAGVGLDRYFRG